LSIIVGFDLKWLKFSYHTLNQNFVKCHLMNNIWLLSTIKTITTVIICTIFCKSDLIFLEIHLTKVLMNNRTRMNSVNPFHINEISLPTSWFYLIFNLKFVIKTKRFGRLRICIILQNWVWNIIEGLMIFIHLVLVKIIKLNFLEHKNSKIFNTFKDTRPIIATSHLICLSFNRNNQKARPTSKLRLANVNFFGHRWNKYAPEKCQNYKILTQTFYYDVSKLQCRYNLND